MEFTAESYQAVHTSILGPLWQPYAQPLGMGRSFGMNFTATSSSLRSGIPSRTLILGSTLLEFSTDGYQIVHTSIFGLLCQPFAHPSGHVSRK